ncbi:cysteine desulfurase [[Clostridium] aminophilum]|uniref:cysteine desulfurase n=1 Tax=[Clostridium] aminophilum TaxID=1526 RepID=A0A1I6IBQ7_9FIRM|nr:cysteine desulfurase [[Clostridium] aminophilum]
MLEQRHNRIYLDHAATTRTRQEAVSAMLPYFTELYGNPSSVYEFAAEPKRAIAAARKILADSIGAAPSEIYFTSGGSESDNWALTAAAELGEKEGKKHIITTAIEHHAILNTCSYLEERGFDVTCLRPDEQGCVSPESVEAAIRPDTCLISVMAANNEIGTIEPVREIGMIARKHGILFHTDAVQAYGHMRIDVKECGIDMMSASAHKLNGPRGVGFLYIRRGVRVRSYIRGGAQEHGRRAGTENTPGIVGFGKAAELAFAELDEHAETERKLRDHLLGRILTEIPDTVLNGAESRLSNNINVTFRGADAESILIMLDMQGICASGGSACASGSLDPSHVLTAIGRSEEDARAAVRLTVGYENTEEEMDYAADRLKEIVARIRRMRGAEHSSGR